MSIEEKIEHLYNKIKEQEKIYALALKMKKDQHALEGIRTGIINLKRELQQLLYQFKSENSNYTAF